MNIKSIAKLGVFGGIVWGAVELGGVIGKGSMLGTVIKHSPDGIDLTYLLDELSKYTGKGKIRVKISETIARTIIDEKKS